MPQTSNFQSGAKPQRTVEDKENVTSVSTSVPASISMTSQTLTSTSPFRVSSGPFPASVNIFLPVRIDRYDRSKKHMIVLISGIFYSSTPQP